MMDDLNNAHEDSTYNLFKKYPNYDKGNNEVNVGITIGAKEIRTPYIELGYGMLDELKSCKSRNKWTNGVAAFLNLAHTAVSLKLGEKNLLDTLDGVGSLMAGVWHGAKAFYPEALKDWARYSERRQCLIRFLEYGIPVVSIARLGFDTYVLYLTTKKSVSANRLLSGENGSELPKHGDIFYFINPIILNNLNVTTQGLSEDRRQRIQNTTLELIIRLSNGIEGLNLDWEVSYYLSPPEFKPQALLSLCNERSQDELHDGPFDQKSDCFFILEVFTDVISTSLQSSLTVREFLADMWTRDAISSMKMQLTSEQFLYKTYNSMQQSFNLYTDADWDISDILSNQMAFLLARFGLAYQFMFQEYTQRLNLNMDISQVREIFNEAVSNHMNLDGEFDHNHLPPAIARSLEAAEESIPSADDVKEMIAIRKDFIKEQRKTCSNPDRDDNDDSDNDIDPQQVADDTRNSFPSVKEAEDMWLERHQYASCPSPTGIRDFNLRPPPPPPRPPITIIAGSMAEDAARRFEERENSRWTHDVYRAGQTIVETAETISSWILHPLANLGGFSNDDLEKREEERKRAGYLGHKGTQISTSIAVGAAISGISPLK